MTPSQNKHDVANNIYPLSSLCIIPPAPKKDTGSEKSYDLAPWGLNNRDRPCLKAGWYTGGF